MSFGDRLPLARAAIDRDALTRDDPEALTAAWADPEARVVALHGGAALLKPSPHPPALDLVRTDRVPAAAPRLYLGRGGSPEESGDPAAGAPVFAVVLESPDADALSTQAERWGDLRLLGAELDARDAGLFTQALALVNWHRSHQFSPRTGEPTVVGRGGWVRYPQGDDEESSGQHVFPRTDPAVIVGVVDDADRLLLASNAAWPDGRFSVLAGFVEPGESFEATVAREVLEESGIRVAHPRYLGSQPWPFPASIMVGFLAGVAPGTSTEPVADGVEIREVRWFTREELSDPATTVRLPGKSSIARAIIEEWYGGELAADW